MGIRELYRLPSILVVPPFLSVQFLKTLIRSTGGLNSELQRHLGSILKFLLVRLFLCCIPTWVILVSDPSAQFDSPYMQMMFPTVPSLPFGLEYRRRGNI
jgi:hypothetical protein